MFVRIVLLWTVYFINLFMFMNIIPHIQRIYSKNVKTKSKRKKNAKEISGFSREFEFLLKVSNSDYEEKEENRKEKNLVNELRSFS